MLQTKKLEARCLLSVSADGGKKIQPYYLNWFSTFIVPENHPEGLVKTDFWGPPPELLIQW